MPRPTLALHVFALLLGCIAAYIGSYLHQQHINPMIALTGTWSGKAVIATKTGKINYAVNVWVQGDNVVLANTAQIDNDKKFAFSIDLEYIEHLQDKILFAVKQRNSIWLDEIRQQGGADIPMLGHLVQVTLVKVTTNEIYMSFTLQNNYSFTTLLQQRV